VQLDNQTHKSCFPIIFAPTPVSEDEKQPMFQLSVNRTKDAKIPVIMFQYISLLIQKIDLKVEESVIYTILGYVNEFGKRNSQFKIDDSELVARKLVVYLHPPESTSTKIFIRFLQLQPIAINVSFQANATLRKKFDSVLDFNPFSVLLSLAGATFGSVDNAPIRLNGVVIDNASGTPETLIRPIIQHYTSQGLKELFKILGSVEFLGNPIGLIGNLGSGVADFFYEPAKGLVKSPQDFTIGLAKGSISLIKNTFTGVFGAASKITGSVGKGVAMLSMDDDFIAKNQRKNLEQPEHLAEGLYKGTKSLGRGLFKGIAGIVMDPIKGAKEDGVGGFFKGVGKGIIGVVTKPASGAIDLASQTLKGVGNTANFLLDDKVPNKRVRPQRSFLANRILTPYNYDEMAKTPKGKQNVVEEIFNGRRQGTQLEEKTKQNVPK